MPKKTIDAQDSWSVAAQNTEGQFGRNLKTFHEREAAFDFARKHAIAWKCNMCVFGPLAAEEDDDEYVY